MRSTELQRTLEAMLDPSRVDFLGVFPRDLEPHKFVRYPSCYVLNTDPSNEPGEHWLALFVTGPNDYEFFDSFAQLPATYGIDNLNVVCVMNFRLQSWTATTCGHYCIYFLVHRSLGHSVRSISNSFSKFHSDWNDKQVQNFVKKPSLTRPHCYHSSCPCTQYCKPFCQCRH